MGTHKVFRLTRLLSDAGTVPESWLPSSQLQAATRTAVKANSTTALLRYRKHVVR